MFIRPLDDFRELKGLQTEVLSETFFYEAINTQTKTFAGHYLAFLEMTLGNTILYVRNLFVHSEIQYNRVYPFAPEILPLKRTLKPLETFSGHCMAIKQ